MTWQTAAIGAVAVLGVLGLVWIFAGRWVSASKGGAVAKDDLKEAESIVEEQRRQGDIMAQPIPKGRKLLELIRLRRQRQEPKP